MHTLNKQITQHADADQNIRVQLLRLESGKLTVIRFGHGRDRISRRHDAHETPSSAVCLCLCFSNSEHYAHYMRHQNYRIRRTPRADLRIFNCVVNRTIRRPTERENVPSAPPTLMRCVRHTIHTTKFVLSTTHSGKHSN